MSQAEASTFVRELREAFAQLDALPMPTVACVDGWVGGVGGQLGMGRVQSSLAWGGWEARQMRLDQSTAPDGKKEAWLSDP